jgi:hypothetical protein
MTVSPVAAETASEIIDTPVPEESSADKTVSPADPVELETATEPEKAMSDTMKLLIGNAIILLLLLAGVIWWRKQTAMAVPAGEMI